MTTDPDKCSLTSLLPMSCRGRAEAFARSLHSRLRSLGSHSGENGSADESSWLGTVHDNNTIALAQPKHSDLYLTLETPASPQEEIDASELDKLLNKDNLKSSHDEEDCHCSFTKEKNATLLSNFKSTKSDSPDLPFYDVVDSVVRQNGTIISEVDNLVESVDDDLDNDEENSEENSNQTEELYVTTSECTVSTLNNSSISEDISTLSLKDELSISLPEIPQLDELDCTVPIDCKRIKENSSGIEENVTNEEHSQELQIKDTDDDDDRIPGIRRCSSLKTGKTPPGTPSRKKIVRFADVLGLDLADVRTFLDDIPKIPTSAYEDLKDVDLNDEVETNNVQLKFHGIKVDKILVPLFQQPGGLPNFLDNVRDNLVCLENALVEDPVVFSIIGTVRVRNLDFHKSVHIRYSLDSWKSYADVKAAYVENSCDGFSDKFKFVLYAHTLTVGQRIEFAARFQCKGCQYWDNNKGTNYRFQCLPATNHTPYTPISCDDSYSASFY